MKLNLNENQKYRGEIKNCTDELTYRTGSYSLLHFTGRKLMFAEELFLIHQKFI